MLLKRKKIDLTKKIGTVSDLKTNFDSYSDKGYTLESDGALFDAICVGDIVKQTNPLRFGIVCHSEILVKRGQMMSNPVQVSWVDDGMFVSKQESLSTNDIVYKNPEGTAQINEF